MLVDLSMNVHTARLLDQAFTPNQIPNLPYPQVAVLGRSNVGKSSLLATMMRRKKLVKVSSRPGKTRGIFFYLVNDALILVDLPGYGFSRAPKAVSSQWRSLIEAYLDSASGPSLALHLIDIRHPPTRDDVTVHGILTGRGIPSIVRGRDQGGQALTIQANAFRGYHQRRPGRAKRTYRSSLRKGRVYSHK
jgi:GTP-binding protein